MRKEDQKSIEEVLKNSAPVGDAKLCYLIYESGFTRAERTNRRLWILCIILVILLTLTNGAWIYYEHQFEDISIEQEVDTGNGDAFVAGDNINYGESKAEDQNKNPQSRRGN